MATAKAITADWFVHAICSFAETGLISESLAWEFIAAYWVAG